MFNLKNVLFVAIFAVLSFNLSATAALHFPASNQEITLNAPQGDGILEITQGKHNLGVKILVPGPVKLIVRDKGGEVMFLMNVQAQQRWVSIPTDSYTKGTYTIEGISDLGTEIVSFTISEEA